MLNPRNIIPVIRKISGKSRITVFKNLYKHYKRIKSNDERAWSQDKPNIGIIGEIYVCCNNEVNFDLEGKIKKFGGNPYNTATTIDFIEDKIPLFNPFKKLRKDKKKEYKIEAQKFIDGKIGGHAFENLYNLLELKDKGIDGVIHVLPLSCTVETCIEPYVNHICRENKIPLLRLPIDENSAEANLETRLETFCELIKMKNGK